MISNQTIEGLNGFRNAYMKIDEVLLGLVLGLTGSIIIMFLILTSKLFQQEEQEVKE